MKDTGKQITGRILNSNLAYHLIKPTVNSLYLNPLRKPTNEGAMKSVSGVESLAGVLIKDPKLKVLESGVLATLKENFRKAIETGKDTNLTIKVKRTLDLMSSQVLSSLAVDFGVMGCGIKRLKQKPSEPAIEEFAIQTRSDCNMNPRCRDCFAEDDTGKLDYKTQRRVIKEALSLGSRFNIILGGEPLLDKNNLFKLFHEFRKMPFIVATNGILLDEAYAKEVALLGNVITLINIPGLEDTTNRIRQNSERWNRVQKAAENLKKYGAASGFASTVYSDTFMELSSPEFVQQMIDFNMLIGFYFGCDNPFGCNKPTRHRMTQQMNDFFSQRAKDIADRLPIFLVDTTNGAEEKIKGCPGGNGNLLLIRSNGNAGSCPMDSQKDNELNVYTMSLKEILKSEYFELLRKRRPHCAKTPKFIRELESLNLIP